jgi:hypothetical protein
MTLEELNETADLFGFGVLDRPSPEIRATTPHGSYVFEVANMSYRRGVITLHLVEVAA